MAGKAKLKKLTLHDIENLNSKLDGKKAIRILDDKYEVLIDEHFRESKLNNVAQKYLTLIQELAQNKDVDDKSIISTISLLPALVIAEFTDLPMQEINTVEDWIKTLSMLLDLGILKDILDSFDEGEIKKLNDKLKQTSKNAGQIIGELAVNQSLKDVEISGHNEFQATGASTK